MQVNGIPFMLREPFDFSFLEKYGRVVEVFDKNDSGNISFGVEREGVRRFIKVAGAKTMNACVAPEEAIRLLRRALPLYEELRHPALIALEEQGEIPGGYYGVFGWAEGECLHAHWTFDQYPKHTHPASPWLRFRRLSVEKRLAALETIFSFQKHVSQKGYVAIDFYDGSLLYDFAADAVHICDIDLYERMPYVNHWGRGWGSSRFMAPEEFEKGAALDETTNVFTMGAMAFALLGGETDRAREKWEASEALYAAALRAVSPRREERYASMEGFLEAWGLELC